MSRLPSVERLMVLVHEPLAVLVHLLLVHVSVHFLPQLLWQHSHGLLVHLSSHQCCPMRIVDQLVTYSVPNFESCRKLPFLPQRQHWSMCNPYCRPESEEARHHTVAQPIIVLHSFCWASAQNRCQPRGEL